MSTLNRTLLEASFSLGTHSTSRRVALLSGSFPEERDRSHLKKKLRLQIPVEPEFAKAQPDFTGSFFLWHSFYLSKSGCAIRFLEY
jgi:hypothetical protein